MARRRWTAAAVSLAVAAAGLVAVSAGAPAVAAVVPVAHPAHDRVVSAVPASWTPQVKNGKVLAIAETGNTMVVGGIFSQVSLASGGGLAGRQNVLAFNATTGAIIGAFNPTVNGQVNAVEPGPSPGTVYLAGSFSAVNGVAGRIVLMNVSTGAVLASFRAPGINGVVLDLVRAGNTLYAAGSFTSVGNVRHQGLVTLNASTGALDPFMNIHLTEHHNFTGQPGEANGAVGARGIDISPDGRWLVAIGNFKKANGIDRDQALMIDLAGTTAQVRADWRTRRFEPRCAYWSFDYYVRDVTFSPDGSAFTVVSTGAGFPGTLCDTASKFATAASGQDVQPIWIQDTGGDSLYSVADTGVAVFSGGHQRWHNNVGGRDFAAAGAVPRPGIGGFDGRSGMPLAWNPARHPRGVGAEAMLVTGAGLWVGSDTNYIGNNQYWRPRLAFFPVAGGKVLGPGATPQLPTNVYLAPGATLTRTFYNGTTPPPAPVSAPGGGINWTNVRGAVVIDGELFYNNADGNFHRRTFDGTTYGADRLIDPYNDPLWANVRTGSGTSTYRGQKPSYYGEIGSIRGLAYAGDRLYYTKSGSPSIFSRGFSPDSGILTQATRTVSGFSVANVGGIFFSGGSLYYTNTGTGNLSRVGWANGAPSGSAVVLSGPGIDGRDWRARTIFAGP